MTTTQTIQFRYEDSGFMHADVTKAREAGKLRSFRVKYQPARCACCGGILRTGMPVISPRRGVLIGRCCSITG